MGAVLGGLPGKAKGTIDRHCKPVPSSSAFQPWPTMALRPRKTMVASKVFCSTNPALLSLARSAKSLPAMANHTRGRMSGSNSNAVSAPDQGCRKKRRIPTLASAEPRPKKRYETCNVGSVGQALDSATNI